MAGHSASIYYATFPSSYLRKIQYDGIDALTDSDEIILHHTEPKSLFDEIQRTNFIDDFIALVLFLVDGGGNIGFVRRHPDSSIHRDRGEDLKNKVITTRTNPPQQVLDWGETDDDKVQYES